jgi:DNA-binding response OmpR family regulator
MSPTSILLVEDDDSIRDALTMALRAAGFTVRAIPLAAQLFDALRADTPDAIVLDLGMPRGSVQGMETLTTLRETDPWRATPVVILSAFGDVVNRDLTRRLGVAAIVGKPFEADDLVEVLRRVTADPPSVASTPRAPSSDSPPPGSGG